MAQARFDLSRHAQAMAGKKGACRREGAAFRESSIPPLFEGFAVHDLVHLVLRVPAQDRRVAEQLAHDRGQGKASPVPGAVVREGRAHRHVSSFKLPDGWGRS